ncbi:hypothetical protein [Polluticaenibacter yanchengensis]|uniref:Uncharacterized protein n=1 Tax=Polluticaenibacter yanchengensis TaxID=3014562 RepID=A0ABT4UI89_9BACT|nr:hypothetical protein [Chitinophagaceae bacterium LY-5]
MKAVKTEAMNMEALGIDSSTPAVPMAAGQVVITKLFGILMASGCGVLQKARPHCR